MIRTQIQLTQEQSRRIRALAEARGISMAEAIRRCVDLGLAQGFRDRANLYERAAELIGQFRDREDARDVSAEHDRYLEEGYGR